MRNIIENIARDLKENGDEKTRMSGQRFFKEQVKLYGVKTGTAARIGKEYYKQVKHFGKDGIFALCDELWKSGYLEEISIACDWSYSVRKSYAPEDFSVFEKWVRELVTNWASCDTLCNHTIGFFIEMYPDHLAKLMLWAKSPNRWMRRASAVSLIVPAKKGKFLREIFGIADILLLDKDDMVQK